MSAAPILSIKGLRADVGPAKAPGHVLRDVSLQVREGALVGVVGESGSGKTFTALSILRLLPRGARITGGSITFDDRNLLQLSEGEMKRLRGRAIAIVFQNAAAALNPLLPIGRQIADVYRVHSGGSDREAWDRAVSMLRVTGLPDPLRQARAYPHELSGGMAQRAMIAMALVGSPRLLIADEPTTGLDVTIQAQVLTLIRERVVEARTTLILISHDIAIVSEVCTDIAVMYAGEVVEYSTRDEVLNSPAHPYTRALLACAEVEMLPGKRLPFIEGQVPAPQIEIRGCAFASRCPTVTEECRRERPPLREIRPGHWVACNYARM